MIGKFGVAYDIEPDFCRSHIGDYPCFKPEIHK